MLAQNLGDKIYLVENGVTVMSYTKNELYEKLSNMDDYTRHNFIKKVNEQNGYEVINYKLLRRLHEQEVKHERTNVKDNKMCDFAKDYTKAYMKMLSK